MSNFSSSNEAPLHRDKIELALQRHPLWVQTEDGKFLRSFRAKNFKAAMDFVGAISSLAVQAKHHPDIKVSDSNMVEVLVYTRSVHGITENDLTMIGHYDAVPVEYANSWSKQHSSAISRNDALQHDIPQVSLPVGPAKIAPLRPSSSAAPYTSASESLFTAPLDDIAPTEPTHAHINYAAGEREPLHSAHTVSLNKDGSPMHPSEFRVHTAHTAPLGDSEVAHHMHHLHEFNAHGRGGMRVNKAAATPADLQRGFARMVHGLEVLHASGYDRGICEQFLPLLRRNAVVADLTDDLKKAHQHIQHRTRSDWRREEPVNVVAASEEFELGYAVVSKVYEDLQ